MIFSKEHCTIAAADINHRRIAFNSLGRQIREERAEALFDWSNFLTEQINHVQKTWMNPKPPEQTSKVLLTYAETTPRVTLIDETVHRLAVL